MKLDKIKFANVIAYVADIVAKRTIDTTDIRVLDDLIDIEVPEPKTWVAVELVDELLKQLNAPDGFIPAIKAYRALTNVGLKEAKDAIERYRSVKSTTPPGNPGNLGNILRQANGDTNG